MSGGPGEASSGNNSGAGGGGGAGYVILSAVNYTAKTGTINTTAALAEVATRTLVVAREAKGAMDGVWYGQYTECPT